MSLSNVAATSPSTHHEAIELVGVDRILPLERIAAEVVHGYAGRTSLPAPR